ncbi:hypothetical protein [Nocardia sp. AG03]|uniref:hypothetical protein n=1 Tax=Nocardia sp. AG03 TaxID=3025312 RepID=UPI0024188B49|nr:hypothetical protein [Nocardia sp. AG03]
MRQLITTTAASSRGGHHTRHRSSGRMLLLAATAVLVAACQSPEPVDSMPSGGFWSAAPNSDEQKIEVLRKVRAIDVCALLPRESLAELGAVSVVENVSPRQCRANMAVDGHPGGIDATWAAGTLFSGEYELGDRPVNERALGDVRTLYAEEPSTDPALRGNCDAHALFVSGASLTLTVRAPRDACATAESLLRVALVNWRAEPAQGSSPDSDRTVVDGADPCAAAPLIGVQVPVVQQGVDQCALTVDGREAVVGFDYREERGILDDIPAFTAGSRQVYRVESSVPSIVTLTAPVGPALAPGTTDALLGPRVPIVTVTADPAIAEQVMRETLATLN